MPLSSPCATLALPAEDTTDAVYIKKRLRYASICLFHPPFFTLTVRLNQLTRTSTIGPLS